MCNIAKSKMPGREGGATDSKEIHSDNSLLAPTQGREDKVGGHRHTWTDHPGSTQSEH